MNARNLFCVLLLFASGASHSSEVKNAEIPYSVMYKIVTVEFQKLDVFKNEDIHFFISSTLPNIKTSDIALYINTMKGRIPLKLNSDGSFSFPLRDDLLKENPYVVTNQPKGTMKFTAYVNFGSAANSDAVDVPDNLKLRYADIFKKRSGVKQVYKNLSENLTGYSCCVKLDETMIWRAEFRSPQPIKTPAVIHCDTGDITVNPDTDGAIRITYNPRLFDENPFVSFPGRGAIKEYGDPQKSGE